MKFDIGVVQDRALGVRPFSKHRCWEHEARKQLRGDRSSTAPLKCTLLQLGDRSLVAESSLARPATNVCTSGRDTGPEGLTQLWYRRVGQGGQDSFPLDGETEGLSIERRTRFNPERFVPLSG